ncbi:MAG: hypothetical protein R3234_02235 [Thermoanaerobaculia bacterium]|nr:hypothetical protein [Thermoanaerobaculia bacterium]
MSDDTLYTARIRIVRRKGPDREAHLPATDEPVVFGVHSEIAEHYGLEEGTFTPHATTIDYLAAATGG